MSPNKNLFTNSLESEKILVKLFFLVYLITGLYIFKDYGIYTDCNIIIGMPGETLEDINDSREFLKKPPYCFCLQVAMVLVFLFIFLNIISIS